MYLKAMVDVNEELTQKVARLAQLKLTSSEITLYTEQLKQILQYVDQLNEVDVQGIEPMVHPISLPSTLREDFVEHHDDPQDHSSRMVDSSAEVLWDGYKVPPILVSSPSSS